MATFPAVSAESTSSFGKSLPYGIAIFASAFLLFQVQPLITKLILPWFGGVAAVWTVCLVFFQAALLAGYSYAHLLSTRFQPKIQAWIHGSVVAASLLALPILPRTSFKPVASANAPAWHILALLTLTVGLPYFVLSSTSPLLQAWYARAELGSAPYRFYSLSNLGSMLALISYPLLVEPFIAGKHQAVGWSVGYGLVALFCSILAFANARRMATAHAVNAEIAASSAAPPSTLTKLLWLAFAACGSALLLAVTNHVSQNIASVPFLWVIPLSLYLLSFIICFHSIGWYRRDLFLRLLAVVLGGMAYALEPSFAVLPMKVLIPLFCIGLWICCMFCHGELARLKPDPAHLTTFYLMISLGGAIGAAFVALLSPLIFPGYYELPCALGFCGILVLVAQFRQTSRLFQVDNPRLTQLVLAALVFLLVFSLIKSVRDAQNDVRRSVRNFYGVLQVIEYEGAESKASNSATSKAPMYLSPQQTSYRRLVNGTISHGMQFLSPAYNRLATTYYSEKSGIGIALRALQSSGELRVGIVGLGAGTLAVYGRPGDRYTFYEINPLDTRIAREEFTFLRDARAEVQIVPGDARLSLENEPPQNYDALVIDAFSSDSIPVHLLTREAFALYFHQLKPDGVLALHISNQYLDLQPVVLAAAASYGKEAVLINNQDDQPRGIYAASWILVGNSHEFRGKRQIEAAGAILLPSGHERLWTDDYSSVLKLLK